MITGKFDWVGGDCSVMEVNGSCPTNKYIAGFHFITGNLSELKAGDKIKIKVEAGDKSYNGTHKIKRIGSADGTAKNVVAFDIPKIGTASGTWSKVNYVPYIIVGTVVTGGIIAYFGGYLDFLTKKKTKKSKKSKSKRLKK